MELFLVPSLTGAGFALHVWLTDVRQRQGVEEPLNLGRYADAAYVRIRQDYPQFAYRFAKETGLLDLPGWERRIAAYWLIPFSEKSPHRTRLINDLYRTMLVEAAIQQHSPTELLVTTDNHRLIRLFTALGRKYGLSVTHVGPGGTEVVKKGNWWRWFTRTKWVISCALRVARAKFWLIRNQLVIRRLLRRRAQTAMAEIARSARPLVAFYTRYPALWENPFDEQARERNFGTFPEFVRRSGYDVLYLCVLSVSAAELRARFTDVLAQAERLRLVFLESLVPFREFLSACLNISYLWRYLGWRKRLRHRPVYYDDLDVKDFVLEDLDNDFLFHLEFSLNCVRAYGVRRFCQTCKPRVLCYPFESQPMERAVYAGVKAGSPETVTVGLEPCVFISALLGHVSAPGEIVPAQGASGWEQAPLPDYIAAYGLLFHEAMLKQCDPERLLLTGAIRYPEIQLENPVEVRGLSIPDPNGIKLLVIGSHFREETIRLLEIAAELCRIRPNVFLLLKFHYHEPMRAEWERLAKKSGCTRYKVFNSDLISLLRMSTATLLGSTSVVAEAIAVGSMPIVLHIGDEFTHCPALDIPESTFLCRDVASVIRAVDACIDRSQTYWERRRAWPDTVEKMFYRLDGRQNERLFESLRSHGVF